MLRILSFYELRDELLGCVYLKDFFIGGSTKVFFFLILAFYNYQNLIYCKTHFWFSFPRRQAHIQRYEGKTSGMPLRRVSSITLANLPMSFDHE